VCDFDDIYDCCRFILVFYILVIIDIVIIIAIIIVKFVRTY